MTNLPNPNRQGNPVVPVFRYDAEKAAHWYERYASLTRIAAANPAAWNNPHFTAARFQAYKHFLDAFAVG